MHGFLDLPARIIPLSSFGITNDFNMNSYMNICRTHTQSFIQRILAMTYSVLTRHWCLGLPSKVGVGTPNMREVEGGGVGGSDHRPIASFIPESLVVQVQGLC